MSDYGVKEALCARCSHREVCSLKAEFLAAQEAIDEAILHRERRDDGAVSMTEFGTSSTSSRLSCAAGTM